MSPEAFAYWLQGFLEISQADQITPEQTQVIKDHLNLVFDKKTPDRGRWDKIQLGGNPNQIPLVMTVPGSPTSTGTVYSQGSQSAQVNFGPGSPGVTASC